MPVGHQYVFFGKMSTQIFCPFLIFFFCVWLSCLAYLYILDISPFIRYMICKYFLPFSRFPFHFVDGFLCCVEAFYFDVVSLVYFYFCCFCFWCLGCRFSHRWRHKRRLINVSLSYQCFSPFLSPSRPLSLEIKKKKEEKKNPLKFWNVWTSFILVF